MNTQQFDIHTALERSRHDLTGTPEKITVKESGEPLIPLRPSKKIAIDPIWITPDPIEGPLYQRYIEKNPSYKHVYARQTIAKKLQQTALLMPENWQLVVRAAHRPIEVQNMLFDTMVARIQKQRQQLSKVEVLRRARIFVSDPRIKQPPHCCGSAVDVDVLDYHTKEQVDFGCPINTDDDIAFLHSDKLTNQQYANRLILLRAMLKAGFASFYSEWWHYSYGDQNWAAFYNQKCSIYGNIEPQL